MLTALSLLALVYAPVPRQTVYAPPDAEIREPTSYVQAAACDWLERTAPHVLEAPLVYRLVHLVGPATQRPVLVKQGTLTC